MTIEYKDSKRIQIIKGSVQGNNGGSGAHSAGAWAGSGGGGGSSSVGSNSSTSGGGNGGNGTANSITGSSITYATGGSGSGNASDGTGGSSNANNNNVGQSATANRGSGGGAAKNGTQGGAGSSGIVIIRFTTSGNTYSQSGGTVDTSTVSGQTIISYTSTSGTKSFTPTSSFNVQYLVVGGGGSAGAGNEPTGAGGSGGYLSSSSYAVTAQAYTVTVGAGGSQPSTSAGDLGNDGSNSSFDDFTAIGGGAGGGRSDNTTIRTGRDGGSGGGTGTDVTGNGTVVTGGSATVVGDTKPTNVQDNSILVEKDTANRYWRTPASTLEIESTGTFTWNGPLGTDDNNHQGFYVANTSSVVYNKTINSVSFWVKSQGSPTGTDKVYCRVWSNSGSGTTITVAHNFGDIDASELTSSYQKFTFNTGSYTLAVGDTVGLEWGSGYTNSPVMQGNLTAGFDSGNTYRGRTTASPTTWSPYSGHNIKFEVIYTAPATWTMEPTFRDDFSSSTGWTTVGSNISITGGAITASSMTTQSENRMYKSLGFTIADNFVMEFEFENTALSSGAHFMISSLTAGSGNINNATNQDAIQLWGDLGSPTFYLRDKDGTTTGTNSTALGYSLSTRYYVTLVNNNRTVTYTLRTGSHTGTIIGTNSITLQSGTSGLTYLQSGSFSGNSGTASYTVDNVKIYNGVTSIN